MFPSSKIRLQLRILILHAMEVVRQEQEKGLSWSDFINPFKTSLWGKHFVLFQWMLPLCILSHDNQESLRAKFFDFLQISPFREHRSSFQDGFTWKEDTQE